jgi:pilus assembly protein CpaB
VRILAIDQTVEEKNGQKVVVGKTATLELKTEQSESLARARQSGTLSLALRSLADANAAEVKTDDRIGKRDSVNIVRYGVQTTTTTQK